MIRSEPPGPRLPTEPDSRFPRLPKLTPDLDAPTQRPLPSDLRR
jgi:hypothetical protein